MGKIIFICTVFFISIYANDLKVEDTQRVEKACLYCHQQNQIPNALIYRRYLVKYSTKEAITTAIMTYIKNPKKEYSIMPQPFFSKFPMKEVSKYEDKVLKQDIERFLEIFDVKKKLVLPK